MVILDLLYECYVFQMSLVIVNSISKSLNDKQMLEASKI